MPHVTTESSAEDRESRALLSIEAAAAAKSLGVEKDYAKLMAQFMRAREALESIPVDPSSVYWRYRARVLKETAA